MSIYLIRHGQTNGNRDRIVQTPDTPLSELGNQQAKLLAQTFVEKNIETILCSDYTRTQQTAAPLQAMADRNFTLEPLLRERSFGDLRGKAYDDIDADFFDKNYAPPNGETHLQFAERVDKAWQSVLKAHEKCQGSVIVMTHGLVLRELVNQHLTINDSITQMSDFQNTCITEVDGKSRSTVIRLCDANHLADPQSLGAAV